MPRSKLANVPLAALQAEIARRKKALGKLIAQRDAMNKQIAELQSLAGPAAPKPRAKRVKGMRKRGSFKETAEQMILGLLASGKSMTTAEINAAWEKAGRGGSADSTLGKLVKAKKLKRRKLRKGKGSNYSPA
jgi:chorismate mutase